MKVPMRPPLVKDVLGDMRSKGAAERLAKIYAQGIGPAPDGKYRHWHTLRHVQPPDDLTIEEWWAAIKIARFQMRRPVALRDKEGNPFHYTLADPVLEMLHRIDKSATGTIRLPEPVVNPGTRDRYVQRSLIEEAITSSQLEGAVATRQVAKEMIRTGREPRDRSERMILNNYQAMQLLGKLKDEPLSADLIQRIHGTITFDTLESPESSFRRPGDGIGVYDEATNRLLHQAPPAAEIPDRLVRLCNFANETPTGPFLHPVIKAIIMHFWFAYDHPFVDGNGRTARALFYWSMLVQEYWLFEFISISRILRDAPARYGMSFLYTETDDNDLTYFILHQLSVICRAIDDLFVYLDRKVNQMKVTARLIREAGTFNHRQIALLTHALRNAAFNYTFRSHQRSHDVAYETARTDLLDLEERGLLRRRKAGKRFVFTPADNLADRLREG